MPTGQNSCIISRSCCSALFPLMYFYRFPNLTSLCSSSLGWSLFSLPQKIKRAHSFTTISSTGLPPSLFGLFIVFGDLWTRLFTRRVLHSHFYCLDALIRIIFGWSVLIFSKIEIQERKLLNTHDVKPVSWYMDTPFRFPYHAHCIIIQLLWPSSPKTSSIQFSHMFKILKSQIYFLFAFSFMHTWMLTFCAHWGR